jgi:hypothetical protein
MEVPELCETLCTGSQRNLLGEPRRHDSVFEVVQVKVTNLLSMDVDAQMTLAERCRARLGGMFRVITINIGIFLALLGLSEIGWRLFAPDPPPEPYYLHFAPYVMFHTSAGTYSRWRDVYRARDFPTRVTANNHGFPMPDDFDLTRPRRKAPGEKVILLTGGSAAWGQGATANDKIVHARLEHHLNGGQAATRYTVINLSMRGWIAQQEAIALDMWGRLFDPDWIVTLDGANDALIGCVMSQGAANPMTSALMRTFIDGYMGQPSVSFYRGRAENELVRISALYRGLTGKSYVPPPKHYATHAGRRDLVIVPTALADLRDQVSFYALSIRSVLERFQGAKFILATQPWVRDVFGPLYLAADRIDEAGQVAYAAELEDMLERQKDALCGGQTAETAMRYAASMGAIAIERLAREYRTSGRRDVSYLNAGPLFPAAAEDRKAYFADNLHMHDAGHDVVAAALAREILARDRAGGSH